MLHVRYPLSGLCPWVLVLTFQLPSAHEWRGRFVPPCHRFLSECWQRPLLASIWHAEWNLYTWLVVTPPVPNIWKSLGNFVEPLQSLGWRSNELKTTILESEAPGKNESWRIISPTENWSSMSGERERMQHGQPTGATCSCFPPNTCWYSRVQGWSQFKNAVMTRLGGAAHDIFMTFCIKIPLSKLFCFGDRGSSIDPIHLEDAESYRSQQPIAAPH